MNNRWVYKNAPKSMDLKNAVKVKSKKSGINVNKIRVGHTQSEMLIHFECHTIIMTPASLKQFQRRLKESVSEFEKNHGKIKARQKVNKKGTVQKLVKALYKTKKLSPKLVSINTKKRKHPTG